MRMDRYDKYKRYIEGSKAEKLIRGAERVYNNIIDRMAAFVDSIDEYMDSKVDRVTKVLNEERTYE